MDRPNRVPNRPKDRATKNPFVMAAALGVSLVACADDTTQQTADVAQKTGEMAAEVLIDSMDGKMMCPTGMSSMTLSPAIDGSDDRALIFGVLGPDRSVTYYYVDVSNSLPTAPTSDSMLEIAHEVNFNIANPADLRDALMGTTGLTLLSDGQFGAALSGGGITLLRGPIQDNREVNGTISIPNPYLNDPGFLRDFLPEGQGGVRSQPMHADGSTLHAATALGWVYADTARLGEAGSVEVVRFVGDEAQTDTVCGLHVTNDGAQPRHLRADLVDFDPDQDWVSDTCVLEGPDSGELLRGFADPIFIRKPNGEILAFGTRFPRHSAGDRRDAEVYALVPAENADGNCIPVVPNFPQPDMEVDAQVADAASDAGVDADKVDLGRDAEVDMEQDAEQVAMMDECMVFYNNRIDENGREIEGNVNYGIFRSPSTNEGCSLVCPPGDNGNVEVSIHGNPPAGATCHVQIDNGGENISVMVLLDGTRLYGNVVIPPRAGVDLDGMSILSGGEPVVVLFEEPVGGVAPALGFVGTDLQIDDGLVSVSQGHVFSMIVAVNGNNDYYVTTEARYMARRGPMHEGLAGVPPLSRDDVVGDINEDFAQNGDLSALVVDIFGSTGLNPEEVPLEDIMEGMRTATRNGVGGLRLDEEADPPPVRRDAGFDDIDKGLPPDMGQTKGENPETGCESSGCDVDPGGNSTPLLPILPLGFAAARTRNRLRRKNRRKNR